MSDSVVFSRRDFLKLVGVGVAGAAAGCGKPPAEKLVPYLIAPEDILPGVPYYFASTCRECPVGCGLVAKTREGRAIKLEQRTKAESDLAVAAASIFFSKSCTGG